MFHKISMSLVHSAAYIIQIRKFIQTLSPFLVVK
jgi:hypothetical protein